MYKPPVELLTFQSPIDEVVEQMQKQQEEHIYKCIINVGVNVDKEELIKALQYDRQQYQKGYKDGIKEFAEQAIKGANLYVCSTGQEYVSVRHIKKLAKKKMAGVDNG